MRNTEILKPIERPAGQYVGRYAPSPTGDLHLGNLRTALVAWQACRRAGGTFILRIEDLDGPRTVPGAEARMIEDLQWLGIDWDEGPDVGGPAGPYRQSERGAVFQAALEELIERGLTYWCTCSRKELREASAPHPEGDLRALDEAGLHRPDGPVYPGTCRGLDPAVARAHPNGAAVRLRVDRGARVDFVDDRLGLQKYDLGILCGDFVIRRRDELWAYQLACAVDDALMGVTHVVRGEDLLSSTPRQIAVMRALGLPEPKYDHIPLVMDETGQRMCKRDGSQSVRGLREAGMNADEVKAKIMAMVEE